MSTSAECSETQTLTQLHARENPMPSQTEAEEAALTWIFGVRASVFILHQEQRVSGSRHEL